MHSPTRLAVSSASVTGLLASADVKLPSIFGDHMVLQRDVAAPVWGWADPGEEVTVSHRRPKPEREGRQRRW